MVMKLAPILIIQYLTAGLIIVTCNTNKIQRQLSNIFKKISSYPPTKQKTNCQIVRVLVFITMKVSMLSRGTNSKPRTSSQCSALRIVASAGMSVRQWERVARGSINTASCSVALHPALGSRRLLLLLPSSLLILVPCHARRQ